MREMTHDDFMANVFYPKVPVTIYPGQSAEVTGLVMACFGISATAYNLHILDQAGQYYVRSVVFPSNETMIAINEKFSG